MNNKSYAVLVTWLDVAHPWSTFARGTLCLLLLLLLLLLLFQVDSFQEGCRLKFCKNFLCIPYRSD